VLGLAIQRGLVDRIVDAPHEMQILLMLGVALILENTALLVFGPEPVRVRSPLAAATWYVGPLYVDVARLLTFAVAIALTAALYVFLFHTDLGRSIRAAADNPYGALVIGTDVRRVYAVAFGIGAACVGAAGALTAPIVPFSPSLGLSASVASFNIVIIGGLGSLLGAFIGGRVAGRRLSQPLAQGARELLAAHPDPSLPARRSLRQARAMKWIGVVAATAVALVLPAVLGPYALAIAINVLFFAYLGQAWNIIGGYAGQLSAGHAVFVGVGGYATAVLAAETGLTPWVGMFVGAALAGALGGVIGYLGFRFGLRGFYFVLLTVAFAEVGRIVVSNWERVGGAVGLYITFTGDARRLSFQDDRAWYYVALCLLLLATAVAWAMERRRFGIYLTAIREDEVACEALGVDTLRYKLLAMVLSSFLTGLAGAFYAYRYSSLQPNAVFGIPLSVEIIIRPIVGGSGTLLGPLVGSLILTPLGELSRAVFGQGGWHGAHLVMYGVLLVAVVLFVPQGVVPWLRDLLRGKPA
jgi:branched-chain amino acid transport system permease protein